MRAGEWLPGMLLMAAACSSAGQGARDAGATGGSMGVGGAPSQSSDTDAANPNVTATTPASPNGQPTTGKTNAPPASGGTTGAGAAGNGGGAGAAANAGATGAAGSAGTTGGATGFTGAAGAPGSLGTAGITGAAGVTGAGGATGGGSTAGAPGATVGAADAMSSGAGGAPAAQASWPTVDCVGGPCAAPNVCVNLDFLFVACVPCGGNDQVCCPPYAANDPSLGTCDAGLICAANPNFQTTPPTDLVRDVCQVPGSPPSADGGLNHERLKLFP